MTDVKASSWGLRFPTPTGSPYGIPLFVALTSITPGSTNDTLKLARLSRNLTAVDAMLQVSDGDTNATPTLSMSLRLTNGTTTKVLIDGSSAGQAGGVARPTKVPATENGVGYTIPGDDYWVDILWAAGAATGAAMTINALVWFTGWYKYGAVTE